MPVTDAQVAALRAFLVLDAEETAPLTYQLGEDGMPGYLNLAETALSIAAGRRFSPRYTSADLVRYVASVRVSRIPDGDEYDFDPAVGETVLRCALGQPTHNFPGPKDRLRVVLALLDELTDSELSSEADVDDLLAEARELADQWLAREQGTRR